VAELPPALAAKITNLRVVRTNGQILVQCPAHDDSTPSLAIRITAEGSALLTCHGGCDTRDVLAAWDLSFPDIMPERKKESPSTGEWTPVKDKFGNNLPATAIYRYTDEKDAILYEVVRVNFLGGGKTFRQRRPDHTKKSGWSWNLEGVRPVLYRLPKVLAAVASGEEVVFCEGEKDVHTAESLGYTATCNSGGAGKGKFLPDAADIFKNGAHVLIVADADEPGRRHARSIKVMIEAVGGIVRVAEAVVGKDLTDHVNAGGTLADLNIVDETEMPDLGMIDFNALINAPEEAYDWLVPGLLEKGERFILTGPEGLGKTSFLRQVATCIACGLDPFESVGIQPRKVVWFDAENSKRQNIRAFKPLGAVAAQLRRPVPDGNFSFFLRPDGLNLAKDDDAAWFYERLAITKPDLVIIGPWYRLFIGNPNDEEVSRKVVAALDKARARYGFAVMIEAHSPHSDGFKANKLGGVRPVRPIGSSLLLRWPEFGYGMSFRDPEPGHIPAPGDTPLLPGMPDFNYCDFMPWRGARDERQWPQALRRSNDVGNWPWLECEPRPLSTQMETVKGSIARTVTWPQDSRASDNGAGRSAWSDAEQPERYR
jgi:5S rRNA maturation endonuclease (ribonuclease M5)